MTEAGRQNNGRNQEKRNISETPLLKTNPTLLKVIERITGNIPDPDVLLATLNPKQLEKMNGDKTNGGKNGDILGHLAETHLAQSLISLSEVFPGLVVNPIPNGTETDDFVFRVYGDHNYVVHKKNTGAAYIEYDAFTLVDGLPVVWEVKFGYSYNGALKNKRVKKILEPLTQYYGDSTAGYVVVTPKASVDESNDAQNKFIERGGILVTLPVTKTEFTEEVQSTIETRKTHKEKPPLQPRRRPIII